LVLGLAIEATYLNKLQGVQGFATGFIMPRHICRHIIARYLEAEIVSKLFLTTGFSEARKALLIMSHGML
jgi:hypothetical protein